MHRFSRGLLFALLLAAALRGVGGESGAPSRSKPEGSAAAAGERLYREGMTRDGRAVQATGVNGVVLRGRDAACAQCHRRSGFGTAEGAFVVRPITANDLFQERAPVAASARIAHQLGKPNRPPYDDAGLAAAVESGVDASGRSLGALMPRYALTADDMRDLAAYLHTLGAAAAEGVDADAVHFAVVIQPGVDAARRAALLAVIDAFVRDKNAAVRSEPARRSAGAMRMYRAYRHWIVDVWQLEGTPAQWDAQLERHYMAQPVFALVSGLGDQDWTPIHQFGERRRLPCILPQALVPALDQPNAYTIYLSGGALLEAEGLARHLAASHPTGTVTQVYRTSDPAARAAAAALRRALSSSPLLLRDQVLPPAAVPGMPCGGDADAATVFWLNAQALVASACQPGTHAYLAGALLADALPAGWEGATRVLRWDSGPAHERRLRRARDWMKARAIRIDDEELQVNALFALSMVGEAMMHMLDSFSREYLLELIEHGVNVSVLPSMYPHLSLGRDLRVAAHEVYLGNAAEGASDSAPGELP